MQTNGDTDTEKPVGEFLSTFFCEQAKICSISQQKKKKLQQ
jgi:hypothetical protein